MTEHYADVWLMRGRQFKAVMMPEGEVRVSATKTLTARQKRKVPVYDVDVELLNGEQIVYSATDIWVAEWTRKDD